MKGRIHALIVDDEEDARQTLHYLLAADSEIEVVGECADGREAIYAIGNLHPHLVFLDVKMPVIDGFDVLKAIDQTKIPLVIFVTAYEEYAVRAFEVHAVEYLHKPFTDERFQEALRYAKHILRTENSDEISGRTRNLLESLNTGRLKHFLVKVKDTALFIKVADVEWIEAEDKYVSLHIRGKSYLHRETFSNILSQLDPEQFLPIHRSRIVNIDFVARFERSSHHEYEVVMRDGTKLKMSRSERKRLGKRLGWDL